MDDDEDLPTPEDLEEFDRENAVDTTLLDIATIRARWDDMADDELEVAWIGDIQRAEAEQSLSPTQQTTLLRFLSRRLGHRLRDLENELRAGIGIEEPTTHDDWARVWLNNQGDIIGSLGSFWTYNEITRIWDRRTPNACQVDIGQLRGPNCRKKSDYAAIRDQAYAIAEVTAEMAGRAMDSAPHGVAIGDAFYRWDPEGGLTREELGPGHLCRFKLDAELTPIEEAPSFHGYLDQAFPLDSDQGVALRKLFAQHLFIALFGLANQLQKVLLWIGPTASGKSTAQRILGSLIPKEVVVHIPPHKWDHEYALASFAHAILNLAGELDYKKVIGTEFLTVTGNEAALMGRHPYGRPFTFQPRTTHVFNSNELPATNIRNEAFFRRWSPLMFLHTVPEDQRNDKLVEAIAERELGAVLSFAFSAAEGLFQGGKLRLATAGVMHDQIMERWKADSNSVVGFIADDEWIEFLDPAEFPDEYVGRQALYDHYRSWCDAMGRRSVNQGEFKRIFLRSSPQACRVVTKGKLRVWSAVRIAQTF